MNGWKHRDIVVSNNQILRVATWGFIILSIAVFLCATLLRQANQDAWILSGIWFPFTALTILYLVNAVFNPKIVQVTVLSSLFVFIAYIIPSLKYLFPYGSTSDVSEHVSLARYLFFTGRSDPSSLYQFTLGFHALIAMLARLSGLSIEIWVKILPGILGGLIPLAFYVFCKQTGMTLNVSRLIIVLSTISLPPLYLLNGTAFTTPLFVIILLLFFVRHEEKQIYTDVLGYTTVLLLLIFQLIFWHPSTSLILPIILLFSGLIILLDAKRQIFLCYSAALRSLGMLVLIAAFTYWMFKAELVWSYFIKNLQLVLRAEITPDLIPVRLSEIPFKDRLIVGMFFHARDAVLIALAFWGLILAFRQRIADHTICLLRTYGLILLELISIIIIVFVIGFGSQGYRRFMFYVVAFSPVLAGYGLWRILEFLKHQFKWATNRYILVPTVTLLFAISAIQVYPYQPATPGYAVIDADQSDAPLVWFHQVNSIYQYHMLEFATTKLPDDHQLLADYIGYRQSLLFFNRPTQNMVRRTTWQNPEPAYILLHWPGAPGAYHEQAEYRSIETIQSWRSLSGVNTIYDNGGSFILYSRDNRYNPFSLEKIK